MNKQKSNEINEQILWTISEKKKKKCKNYLFPFT